ncbi:hypothetical protein ACWAT4_10205 [Bradyrhizobium manausense]
MSVSAYIDEVRRQKGLLTPAELIDLSCRGNLFYDPYSVLISARAVIGRDNVFFPGVYLFCTDGGALEVQNGNTFHANTLIEASNGSIRIGSHNQFGEGGFTAKANRRVRRYRSVMKAAISTAHPCSEKPISVLEVNCSGRSPSTPAHCRPAAASAKRILIAEQGY